MTAAVTPSSSVAVRAGRRGKPAFQRVRFYFNGKMCALLQRRRIRRRRHRVWPIQLIMPSAPALESNSFIFQGYDFKGMARVRCRCRTAVGAKKVFR